jgi:predicted metalloendopeptidase
MNKILTGIAVLLLVTGCNKAEQPIQTDTEVAGTTMPLISGVDLSAMSKDVRPQDDYYRYANGTWLANTEIPAEEVGWGGNMTLHKKSLEQSRAIAEELAAKGDAISEEQQIGGYYKAWMNKDLVESLGVSPLAADLAEIDSIKTHDDVAAHFGKVNPEGVSAPFNFYVSMDDKNSSEYVVFFVQTGLGLPDREYYFDESDRGKALRDGYVAYVTRLMALSGYPEPEAAAQRVLAVETRLAEHHWTNVENRDADKTYNPYDREGFSKLLSNFNLNAYLKGIGVEPQDKVIVSQPSYLEAVNTMFPEIEVRDWKEYLRMRLLTSFANFLSQEFVDARFDFYSRMLYGREEQQPRWRMAISYLNGNLGEVLGKIYVERHFSPEAKVRMEVMVDNLIAAYGDAIRQLDWMGEETKEKALLKLSKFTPKIGYPDRWKDYSDLVIDPEDLVGNIKRARSWGHYDNVGKLGQPIDKDEWLMSPQTVNAYYMATANEIVFPAAYLQPPNFILEAEDAYNYGAVGSTIGHEIGHGFDDQGSKFDGDGNLKSWWTEEDRANFEARTKGLVEQYSKFEALPGLFLNGELTLGENIGDLGGTAIALQAYKRSLNGKQSPVIDGFTGEERFFLGNAQASKVLWRDQFIEMIVKTDPHSPDEFRVNGVFSNLADFHRVYGLKEGDGMYVPDEQRVSIWE